MSRTVAFMGLTALGEVYRGAAEEGLLTATFKPKSEEDYLAVIRSSVQRRSRRHERLVCVAGENLRALGAEVSTPHPIDLLMTKPTQVIFEAKPVGRFGALLAVRQAIGQLFEYRRFIGPRQARLCILLDEEPPKELVDYVEGDLGLLIAWVSMGRIAAGPATLSQWPLP
jgi:hypothetical protein